MISNEAIATLVTSYFAATRDMDVEAWLATFAEDAISHDPVGEVPLRVTISCGNTFSKSPLNLSALD